MIRADTLEQKNCRDDRVRAGEAKIDYYYRI